MTTIELPEKETDHPEWTDFCSIGPGTLMGRWLRTFWQPVYVAADLPVAYPKPIKMLGEQFTLYRGQSGEAHAVGFRCAHRRTQLSPGWVEGENIRCIFHGWMYDPSGQCVDQPAEPEFFGADIKIPSYPVEEYLGLLFVYMGDGPPPPLPRYPDVEAPVINVDTKFRDTSWYNHLALDRAHVNFTHFHRADEPLGRAEVPDAEETDWGLTYKFDAGSKVDHTTHFGMPNITSSMSFTRPGRHPGRSSLRFRVAIDDDTHRDFWVRGFANEEELAERQRSRAGGTTQREHNEQAREYARLILAGEMRIEDVTGTEKGNIIGNTEDNVTQGGMMPNSERFLERLGPSDTTLVLRNSLFERELRTLAEGGELKQWHRPERLQYAGVAKFLGHRG